MKTLQQQIIETLQVKPAIDPLNEFREIVENIKTYIRKSGRKGIVLGISGGQDSTLTGKASQTAVNELNEEVGEKKYKFVAMRLPYGVQKDEQDAQDAIAFIQPDEVITINIKAAVDASVQEFKNRTGQEMTDFIKGNRKARERMEAQYDVAGQFGLLVFGTDHAAEAISGFYTKFGDGACDYTPITGLNKRQGKLILKELGCPQHLYLKAPTADLEDNKPGLADEVALGVTYEQIDDYLEGKEVEVKTMEIIENRYVATEHKRQQPANRFDTWWK
jgi:NAD+ synthase